MNRLETNLGGLRLKNPVIAASGTFGYGTELQTFFDVAELGAVVIKGLSLLPRRGNPSPRVWEVPSGMLNAIGLANIGVEAFCSKHLPVLRSRGVSTVINLYATSLDEFSELVRRLEDEDGISAYEVNISCPNVREGGLSFGMDPSAAGGVTRAVRRVTKRSVWVKLSPEAPSLGAVARACEAEGADALVAINTIRGMAIDVHTWRPRIANGCGGLSGPAIHPIAVRMVWEVAQRVRIPVIGVGGVRTAWDAVEFFLAGASAIQVGSASFHDPLTTVSVIEGIRRYCEEKSVSISDLVGKVRMIPRG
jgi:dihydroorotate dehydrogenase (NAD+) catalytic subunit